MFERTKKYEVKKDVLDKFYDAFSETLTETDANGNKYELPNPSYGFNYAEPDKSACGKSRGDCWLMNERGIIHRKMYADNLLPVELSVTDMVS